jgi:hypothetical protein
MAKKLVMVAYTCNSSSQEAEEGGSQVQGQAGKDLSKKKS